MPVRKIPKNYRFVTGVCAVQKARGRAGFEGLLEREHLTLLDFNPHVRQIEVQPVKITWFDANGRRHKYTPDCLVTFDDEALKPVLVEVKPRELFWKEWREERQKFRAAVHYAAVRGWKFTITTEKEIRTKYLESVLFLTPFVRGGATSEQDLASLLQAMNDVEESTPRLLLEMITADLVEQARLLQTFWYLVGTFRIGADLDQSLSMEMKIWQK